MKFNVFLLVSISAALSLFAYGDCEASAENPTLVIQGGERGTIVSNGAKWILGSGELLDGITGLGWGPWPTSSGAPILFTPDATRVLTVSLDRPNEIAVCAVPSGRILCEMAWPKDIPVHSDGENPNPDPLWCDNSTARTVIDSSICDFELKTGRLIRSRPILNRPQPMESDGDAYNRLSSGVPFFFSLNGEYMVGQYNDNLMWWRTIDGKRLGCIRDPVRILGKTSITNDGRWVASEGDDPDYQYGDTASGGLSRNAHGLKINIWSTSTGGLVRSLDGYPTINGGAQLLQFTADGNTLVGCSESNLDRFNWRAGTDDTIPQSHGDEYVPSIEFPLGISPDGNTLIGTQDSDSPHLKVWDIRSGKCLTGFPGQFKEATPMKWSPDGRFLAGGTDCLAVWDSESGRQLASAVDTAHGHFVGWWDSNTATFESNYGVNTGWWYTAFDRWKGPGFVDKRSSNVGWPPDFTKSGSGPSGQILSLSPGGHTAVAASPRISASNLAVYRWDSLGHFAAAELLIPMDQWPDDQDNTVWFPDDSAVAVSGQGEIVVWSLTDGTKRDLIGPEGKIFPPAPPATDPRIHHLMPLSASADGHWLVGLSVSNNLPLVYDLRSGRLIRTMNTTCGPEARFLNDSRTVVLQDEDGALEWWDLDKVICVHKLQVGPGSAWEISPDGSHIAVTGSGAPGSEQPTGYVSIFSIAQGREVVELYVADPPPNSTSCDWFAITPQGYYLASPGGERRLRWRDSNGFWPIEKSRAKFCNPRMVAWAISH